MEEGPNYIDMKAYSYKFHFQFLMGVSLENTVVQTQKFLHYLHHSITPNFYYI